MKKWIAIGCTAFLLKWGIAILCMTVETLRADAVIIVQNPWTYLASGTANPLPDNLWTSCVCLCEVKSDAGTNINDTSASPTYNGVATNVNTTAGWTLTNDGGFVSFDGVDDYFIFQTNKTWDACSNQWSMYAFMNPKKEQNTATVLGCGGDNVANPGLWMIARWANNFANANAQRNWGTYIARENDAAKYDQVVGNTVLVCSNWYGVGARGWDLTNVDLFVAGVVDKPYTTNTTSGLNFGRWMASCGLTAPQAMTGTAKYDGTIPYLPGNFDFGFFAVFDRALTTNEFQQLDDLFDQRFGL